MKAIIENIVAGQATVVFTTNERDGLLNYRTSSERSWGTKPRPFMVVMVAAGVKVGDTVNLYDGSVTECE